MATLTFGGVAEGSRELITAMGTELIKSKKEKAESGTRTY
jgi:hypothetical protein